MKRSEAIKIRDDISKMRSMATDFMALMQQLPPGQKKKLSEGCRAILAKYGMMEE